MNGENDLVRQGLSVTQVADKSHDTSHSGGALGCETMSALNSGLYF